MIGFFKFPFKDSLAGAEFHTLKLAKHYQETGREVKLFTSDRKLEKLFRDNNLPVEYLWVGWEPTSRWSLFLWPVTFFIARTKFKKLVSSLPKNSTLFFQSLPEKLILTSLAQKRGFSVFWIEHKVPGRWLKQNPLLSRYLRLARRIQIITVSNFAKKEFISLGVPESNIQVIYPAPSVTLERSDRVSDSVVRRGGDSVGPSGLQNDKIAFTIGLLSRLDKEKGVYEFLKTILPTIKERGWQVLVAGVGSEKKSIENLIEKSGLQNQIKLLGFVQDLDDFFSRTSVLCYPTKAQESFGVSIIEAMARGVPVVATKIGAPQEIIENKKSGLLINPDKPLEWVQYLSVLTLNEIYSEISKNGHERAKNFSETKMFEGFNHLLKN